MNKNTVDDNMLYNGWPPLGASNKLENETMRTLGAELTTAQKNEAVCKQMVLDIAKTNEEFAVTLRNWSYHTAATLRQDSPAMDDLDRWTATYLAHRNNDVEDYIRAIDGDMADEVVQRRVAHI
ncbi:hypothetical protein W97_05980 [Coniosporium apollinis CBS 100218]|uniref:Uncharacterized protein n=1 Tax=Coniosporium apollinis (strain CBS 100218) TaxID=1168221 RepID=R7YY70_CONA1|nr:uncharacterized protein W97_05980 [Coniosporium apollinis CBS 100218]EON66734.1 hypothetical protein W97_05980 [Coniosporium apollinis CBS 100218]